MNFFNYDASKGLVVTKDIWIYFLIFALLTGATLALWRFSMNRVKRKAAKNETVDEEKGWNS